MKARIKATGEIVEVYESELMFLETTYNTPDYWTRLEHTYAGMAMQGMMSYIKQITPKEGSSYCDDIVDISFNVAHALVEKMKEEK